MEKQIKKFCSGDYIHVNASKEWILNQFQKTWIYLMDENRNVSKFDSYFHETQKYWKRIRIFFNLDVFKKFYLVLIRLF